MAEDNRHLDSYIREGRGRFEEMLGQAVEIPSISMDPAYAADIRRMAKLAAEYLRDAGAEAHIVETAGYPIVSGGWTTNPAYPTVTCLLYTSPSPRDRQKSRMPSSA